MRTREEIEESSSKNGFYSEYRQRDAILEALLDIRDLLIANVEKEPNEETNASSSSKV